MNILCIDQYVEVGGAQRTLLDLIPAFARNGWNVHVALPGTGPLTEAVHALGLTTDAFRLGRYSKVRKTPLDILKYATAWPATARGLLRIVRHHAIDLIYVNGPRVLPAAALVARCCSLPLVFHCHNRLHQPGAVQLAGRSLSLARAQVVACCRYAAEPIRPYLESGRLRILYNGIALPETTLARPAERPRRLGVIGRIEEEKGQLEFVKAAHLLFAQFPGLTFSLVGAPLFTGHGYLQQVRQAARNLPLAFEGWKDHLADVFASLDLLVVPSSALDATPRVIIEALAMGVPVVAFAAGGIPEIIRDNQTGFLVHESTPQALAARIASVLRMSPDELMRVKKNALQAWRENYSLAAYRQDICALVQRSGTGA